MKTRSIPLSELCWYRSGDKGDISNIGLMAKDERGYDIIREAVTPERVKAHFKDWVKGDVTIYEVPNMLAIEIVLREGLGGGATKSLRVDQTGKAMCVALGYMKVPVPEDYFPSA